MKEIENILLKPDVLTSIQENQQTLFSLIPELKRMIGFSQNHPHHHLDVWGHTLLALSFSEVDLEIRLALLLHDIGKTTCYQDGKVRHFHGHPYESFHVSIPILERLGYSPSEVARIGFLIACHDESAEKVINEMPLELIQKLVKMQYCDAKAHHPDYVEGKIKRLDEIVSVLGLQLESSAEKQQ